MRTPQQLRELAQASRSDADRTLDPKLQGIVAVQAEILEELAAVNEMIRAHLPLQA